MNSLAYTNDPRESKRWTFGLRTNSHFTEESEGEWAELERRTTLAKSGFKVICFSTDSPNSKGMEVDHIWERGYCRPRMWSQYAENHKGACLVFDRSELRTHLKASISSDTDLFEATVRYQNRSQGPSLENNPFILNYDSLKSIGAEQTLLAHVERYRKELFFEKATDWSHESEYRFLIWDRGHDAHIVPFGSALKGIVLGESFPEQRLGGLSLNNLDIGRLRWKNGVPEVVPIPISPETTGS